MIIPDKRPHLHPHGDAGRGHLCVLHLPFSTNRQACVQHLPAASLRPENLGDCINPLLPGWGWQAWVITAFFHPHPRARVQCIQGTLLQHWWSLQARTVQAFSYCFSEASECALIPTSTSVLLIKPVDSGKPHKGTPLFSQAWWTWAPRDYNNRKDISWEATTPRALHRQEM